MRIIDRYLGSAILGMTVVVAVALLGINAFLALIEEFEDVGKGQYEVHHALQYVALTIPNNLYQMFPLIVMLATILGLGALAGTGELVVIRASGVSVWRIGGSTLKIGVLLAALCFVIGDWVAPHAERLADEVRSQAKYGTTLAGRKSSLWLRAGGEFVLIDALESERRIRGVEILDFDENRALRRYIRADYAVHQADGWMLQGVYARDISGDSVTERRPDQLLWGGALEPDLLRLVVLSRDNLSTAGLFRYVRYLRANGLDDSLQQLALWRKIVMPFTVIVMILIAVPFVIGPLRDAGAGQRLFIGVMCGVVFYLVNEITANTGNVYGLNPVATAAAPTLIVLAIALWRLFRTR